MCFVCSKTMYTVGVSRGMECTVGIDRDESLFLLILEDQPESVFTPLFLTSPQTSSLSIIELLHSIDTERVLPLARPRFSNIDLLVIPWIVTSTVICI